MNACAYVIGPDNGSATTLLALARHLGFETVLPFGSIADAERRMQRLPLSFFLFAEVGELGALREPARAIRSAESAALRFSPLIYFCRNPSLEAIRRCIGMGFDDIITEPFTAERVGGRLQRQVGTQLAFYETADYFGPDRRRDRERQEAEESERRGGGRFRRIEILRDFLAGIRVLDDGEQVML